jgi:hypothetical protein
MSTVDEYHKCARDCLGGPPGLGPKKQRMQFLSLAHDWTQAALGLQGVPFPSEPDYEGLNEANRG